MKQVILDFFQLGFMRIISRILSAGRGIVIVTTLLPSELGQFTIWILFVFYFSIADFGILMGLERDIPHHKGKEDEQALKDVLNIGMSSFFVLSFLASLLLGIVTFIVYQKWLLSVLLGIYLFTDKIENGIPIQVFNNGNMKRDFTYIDDIISGTRSAIDKNRRCEVFNLGNQKSEELMNVINLIEENLGKKA